MTHEILSWYSMPFGSIWSLYEDLLVLEPVLLPMEEQQAAGDMPPEGELVPPPEDDDSIPPDRLTVPDI